MSNMIRILPYHYIHIEDTNLNTVQLVRGPRIYVKQDHERLASGSTPLEMVALPPRTFVVVENPVIWLEDGSLSMNKHGQANVRYGDFEIRFHENYPEPFPLYPDEKIKKPVSELEIIPRDSALLIEAERQFTDCDGNDRQPGDRWYLEGPVTYYPRIEEKPLKRVASVKVGRNQALRLFAERELQDRDGVKRKAGEEWIMKTPGAYLPGVYERVIETVQAKVITDYLALHLRATRGFTDTYEKKRKAGEEWMVTSDMTDSHLPDVYEEFVSDTTITVLNKNQFCIVLDPWEQDTGVTRYGSKELRRGERSFFLMPGEVLSGGIQDQFLLSEEDALLLRANESVEVEGEVKKPGDRWMIHGPCSFIPPIEVDVIEVRKAIPLHVNEGIYVRDIKTGSVRAEFGKSYMLKAHEEPWEMHLNEVVTELLSTSAQPILDRTRVISYCIPANSVVQVYNYKDKKSRVVMGPDIVHLLPDEQFTVNVLSGSKPKRVGVVKSLHLQLGPEFSTDVIEVDTSDHARLRVQLSYNWQFEVECEGLEKVFKVRDFVGNLCNFMAAKVRGAVAAVSFEQFHRESARVIRKSVFGLDDSGHINDSSVFHENGLTVTNVDIQSIEPVEKQTKERLQESVTLAIEITSRSEEAKSIHSAQRQAQEAMGIIDKLKIENLAKVEEENLKYLTLHAESQSVQSEGIAIAKAKAKAETNKIDAESQVNAVELRTKADKIQKENQILHIKAKQELEIEHQRALDGLEIARAKQLSEIEAEKFKKTIGSIGSETLVAISEAGPKAQAELLEGLGLQGYMIMDTNNPVNLFSTAEGMLATRPS